MGVAERRTSEFLKSNKQSKGRRQETRRRGKRSRGGELHVEWGTLERVFYMRGRKGREETGSEKA